MDKNIIWLVSWYPNKLSPFDGDFIQRHARAVSLFQKITVIYIRKDDKGKLGRRTSREVQANGNLTEITIFYYPTRTPLSLINRLISTLKYKRLYRRALEDYIAEFGKPDLAHVHVAYKAGLQALWLKKKYGIPFVISEHWSGYLPDSKVRFSDFSGLVRKIIAKIFKKSSDVSVVSEELDKGLRAYFGLKGCRIIPNVVDTTIFYPETGVKNQVRQFIHISNLTEEKNVPDILQAAAIVMKNGHPFHLRILGPKNEEVKAQVEHLGLVSFVEITKEVPQKDLAHFLRESDGLILYSQYETFGCVVIESNACGVPVLLSDLPVFHEFISAPRDGIFVPLGNPEALARVMENLITNAYRFDKVEIARRTAGRFSFEAIGGQMNQWYHDVLNT